MINRNLLAFAVATLALLGCTTPPSPQDMPAPRTPGFGESKATAIEVCMPRGQRAYLDLLQCADGSPAAYRRLASVGQRTTSPSNLTEEQELALIKRIFSDAPLQPGEPDYHILDGYELACGAVKRVVYMDMYHCHQAPPAEAPPGFRFRRPS
jgi:hypothetical protein